MRMGLNKRLLATASALTIAVCTLSPAQTAENGFWVELGGQFDFSDSSKDNGYIFGPIAGAVFNVEPGTEGFNFIDGLGGPIAGTPWSFAVRGKYGYSDKGKDLQSSTITTGSGFLTVSSRSVVSKERHAVIDFEVGRDVGLGILGIPAGALKLKAGVRYADSKGTERGKASGINSGDDENWLPRDKIAAHTPCQRRHVGPPGGDLAAERKKVRQGHPKPLGRREQESLCP